MPSEDAISSTATSVVQPDASAILKPVKKYGNTAGKMRIFRICHFDKVSTFVTSLNLTWISFNPVWTCIAIGINTALKIKKYFKAYSIPNHIIKRGNQANVGIIAIA